MRPRRMPVLLDVLLAAVLTGLSVATLVGSGTTSSVGVPGVLLAVLAVAPIAVRQVAPVLTLVVIALALAAYALLGYGEWPSGAVGMVVAMFTVATLRPRPVAAATYPVTVAVLLLSALTVDDVGWSIVLQAALICLCAWVLGDSTRRWARRAEEQAAGAERDAAEERNRIARELHDVVTHHMSVVTLQTGLADYVLESDPATARTAVRHAGAAGREALADLRRMLDALRTDDAPARTPYQPQPGLGRLDALVRRLSAAGLHVQLERTGRVRELSTGLELCAYRVVQEALTNVLKHAGAAATARVAVDYGDRVLTVEVTDDGAAGPASPPAGTPTAGTPTGTVPGSGLGLRGMRERAELYGGVLEAAPRAGGGFRVRLRLPTTEPADADPTDSVHPVHPVAAPVDAP